MFKSNLRRNKRGAISWILSQISLMIAAAVLLASIASLTFYSDSEKKAEIKSIASKIATEIESVDLSELPATRTMLLGEYDHFEGAITLSTDYVSVWRDDGLVNKNLVVREALLIKPYIRPDNILLDWYTGNELIWYLENEKGYTFFEETSAFASDAEDEIMRYLDDEMQTNSKALSQNPFEIDDAQEPLFLEKIFIYFGSDEEITNQVGYVIVHQRRGT